MKMENVILPGKKSNLYLTNYMGIKVRFLLLSISLILVYQANAQIDQDKIMTFLNQSSSGRVTAHGNYAIAQISADINAIAFNAAMYDPQQGFQLGLNNQFHLLKSNAGNIFAGTNLKKIDFGLFGGLSYFTSGNIDGYDENGQATGAFSASDIAILIGANKQLYNNLRVGATLKYVTSAYESYHASAIMLDLSTAWHKDSSGLFLGLAFRNMGAQLATYAGIREPLPFSIEASGSVRLKHLPLRIGLVAHHLQRWNLLYDNPNNTEQSFSFDDLFNEPALKKYGLFDNLMRHLVIQTELSIGKKEGFKIRLAYNHFRKRELSVNNLRSLAGFSGGIGLRISKFNLDYGITIYNLAGKTHTLSLSTDLFSWKKKPL